MPAGGYLSFGGLFRLLAQQLLGLRIPVSTDSDCSRPLGNDNAGETIIPSSGRHGQRRAGLSLRFTSQIEPVGVMNQPVWDSIGQGGIGQLR